MIIGLQSNAIHVGCNDLLVDQATAMTSTAGGVTFELWLNSIANRDDLVQEFVRCFRMPWPIQGLDAVISTASDLDWIPGNRSFLVIVRGLDDVPRIVLQDVAVAFPNIIDRMRGAGDRYITMFSDSPRTSELLGMATEENESLAELERIDPESDTHPVPIIDHRSDLPASAPSSRGCPDAP